eukprot:1159232-Pelagomonas_calceolata.AAC.17
MDIESNDQLAQYNLSSWIPAHASNRARHPDLFHPRLSQKARLISGSFFSADHKLRDLPHPTKDPDSGRSYRSEDQLNASSPCDPSKEEHYEIAPAFTLDVRKKIDPHPEHAKLVHEPSLGLARGLSLFLLLCLKYSTAHTVVPQVISFVPEKLMMESGRGCNEGLVSKVWNALPCSKACPCEEGGAQGLLHGYNGAQEEPQPSRRGGRCERRQLCGRAAPQHHGAPAAFPGRHGHAEGALQRVCWCKVLVHRKREDRPRALDRASSPPQCLPQPVSLVCDRRARSARTRCASCSRTTLWTSPASGKASEEGTGPHVPLPQGTCGRVLSKGTITGCLHLDHDTSTS